MTDRPRVLVCDDEPQILRALKVLLRDGGYDVDAAATVEEALNHAALRPPDAAIIDLVLPDGTGIDVCRQLREWSEMPIIVLSAVGEEDVKVDALAAGADDYVTKPFGPRELLARLQAVLRRSGGGAEEPSIRADGLEIDLAAHVVRRDGEPVHLTPTEFELLRTLARNRGTADDPPDAADRGVGSAVRATTPRSSACTSRTCAARSSRPKARATSRPTPASATASPHSGPLFTRSVYAWAKPVRGLDARAPTLWGP